MTFEIKRAILNIDKASKVMDKSNRAAQIYLDIAKDYLINLEREKLPVGPNAYGEQE